jgi:hypothetical protein
LTLSKPKSQFLTWSWSRVLILTVSKIKSPQLRNSPQFLTVKNSPSRVARTRQTRRNSPSRVARTRQTRLHSPSRVARTRQTRRHLPSRVARTCQTRRHSPSRVAWTRQTCRHSPKAIFEKNVTRLVNARVSQILCEWPFLELYPKQKILQLFYNSYLIYKLYMW